MLDELLVESGLALTQFDAVAFGRGPGLFTGLRIGAGVVQGLAFGADLPVVPVSSLAALAQGLDTERTLSAFDARMSQVYWGAYVRNAQGMVELVGGECVVAPQCVPLPETGGWHGAGSGWDQYSDALAARLGTRLVGWRRDCYPLARHVAQLGAMGFVDGCTVAAEDALPVYIRDEVAAKARPR